MYKLLISVLMLAVVSYGSVIYNYTQNGVNYKGYEFIPSSADLGDLPHESAKVWGIELQLAPGEVIDGATLEIKNLHDWQTNEWNALFIELLDDPKVLGVTNFPDNNQGVEPNGSIDPATNNQDYFDNWAGDNVILNRYNWNNNKLYEDRTAPINGATPTLVATGFVNTKAITTFTKPELDLLTAYILKGNNFGIGADADCHFYNDGFKLNIKTHTVVNVPEPGSLSLILLGLTGLAGGLFIRRKRK